ncbi:uncharacterized protein LOC124439115 isoform X2 [Xenia sp. Carnegie-2017]|uniref:uncharacterized protein LOC124439115 isoform X2 n=1 Tax=Xenia sp. Carnegie-2017 TaxID=2897299 RepID=UPI001F034FCF|nr:uncharacterized protein LOC124439115 isoform X2 [Xenia sp. Carnegie-2017]
MWNISGSRKQNPNKSPVATTHFKEKKERKNNLHERLSSQDLQTIKDVIKKATSAPSPYEYSLRKDRNSLKRTRQNFKGFFLTIVNMLSKGDDDSDCYPYQSELSSSTPYKRKLRKKESTCYDDTEQTKTFFHDLKEKNIDGESSSSAQGLQSSQRPTDNSEDKEKSFSVKSDPNEENHDKNFKKLLDETKSIKADVHEALQSCAWLSGEYGTTGPNETMPFSHLYVTVNEGEEKSYEIFKKDIDEKFGWEASKYVELRSKPLKEAKFRMLSEVHAVRSEGNRSTLTVFCLKNDTYYALTCAHAGVVDDLFVKNFGAISANIQIYKTRTEYFYMHPNNDRIVPLQIGQCEKPTRFVMNEEVDIMNIAIGNKEDFQQIATSSLQPLNLCLHEANQELSRRIDKKNETVKARAANARGVIQELNYCKSDLDNQKKAIYKNAVKVKIENDPFLRSGDSGALVYFLNKENNWKPFAYVVAEIENEIISDSSKTYICLKLERL